MGKPLVSCRKEGLVSFKCNRIVAQALTKNQASRFLQLSKSITRHELTETLEILVKSGIDGDLAIFITANLQDLLGRAV